MDLIRYLFDNDWLQRSDIEELRSKVQNYQRSDVELFSIIKHLARRCDRLELLCEALAQLAVDRKLTTQEELAVLLQQIDLSDGHEDGARRARVDHSAPRCQSCGRFRNPKRSNCVFCGAVSSTTAGNIAPSERSATCGGCGNVVMMRHTFYTPQGLRCDSCFQP